MGAILFGSISTLADTSELQREAFNAAFAQHGLDWTWDREEYVGMLEGSGGADRVARYAEVRGEEVDAAAVHATKSELFQQRLADSGLSPRPGVAETIAAARQRGLGVGLVTTTAPRNVEALLAALAPALGDDPFDVVTDTSTVEGRKPAPAAYLHTLATLQEEASACVAIEDNLEGVQAAQAAGIPCLAFPNQNTAEHDFGGADAQATTLVIDELTALTRAA